MPIIKELKSYYLGPGARAFSLIRDGNFIIAGCDTEIRSYSVSSDGTLALVDTLAIGAQACVHLCRHNNLILASCHKSFKSLSIDGAGNITQLDSVPPVFWDVYCSASNGSQVVFNFGSWGSNQNRLQACTVDNVTGVITLGYATPASTSGLAKDMVYDSSDNIWLYMGTISGTGSTPGLRVYTYSGTFTQIAWLSHIVWPQMKSTSPGMFVEGENVFTMTLGVKKMVGSTITDVAPMPADTWSNQARGAVGSHYWVANTVYPYASTSVYSFNGSTFTLLYYANAIGVGSVLAMQGMDGAAAGIDDIVIRTSDDDFLRSLRLAADVDFSGTPVNNVWPGSSTQFTDGSPDLVSWDWDFGDGSIHSTSQNPLHTWVAIGTYTVTLTGVDSASGTLESIHVH